MIHRRKGSSRNDVEAIQERNVGNHQVIICQGCFAEALNVGLRHNKKCLGL